MILPVLVTEHYISSLLVDDADPSGDIKIKGNAFFQIPFQEDPLKPKVDFSRIERLVKEKLGKESEELEPMFITEPVDQLVENIPLPVIFLDHFNFSNHTNWEESDINTYHNNLNYAQPIPKDLKGPIDADIVKTYVKKHVGSLIGMHHVLLVTPGTCGIDHKTYVKKLIGDFANSVNIAGIWDFTLDDQIGLIPFSVILKSKGLDLGEYFKEHPLKSDAKLVIAPGVEDVLYSREEKNKDADFKTEKLKKDSITTISIKADEKVNIKWKNQKSKYDGQMYGSELGIIIANNERRSGD